MEPKDITLRDWFAGMVLQGFHFPVAYHLSEQEVNITCQAAYQLADALLKTREEKE